MNNKRSATAGLSLILWQMNDYSREVNDAPVPKQLFMDLVEISFRAMSGQLRVMPPDAERCLEEHPGAIYLTDIPENQMGMAIVRECRQRIPDKEEAEATAKSFLHRWFAILHATKAEQLAEFITPVDGGTMINDAVFVAAADSPVDGNLHFGKAYIEKIRQIVAEEEGGE